MAEYAEYAKPGSKSPSISFPRIWRIPQFNPCGGFAPTQFFAAGEQIEILQCRETCGWRQSAETNEIGRKKRKKTKKTVALAATSFVLFGQSRGSFENRN